MPFKKGQSGNPLGKKPGIKNKKPKDLRWALSMFVESKMAEIDDLWTKLTPKERVNFLMEAMKYMIPRLNAITTEINVVDAQEKIINLFPTDEEIEQANQ